MSIIGDKVKSVVEAQGLTYVRSFNDNDLNEKVGRMDIASLTAIGVYANTPVVNVNRIGKTPQVIQEEEVEVLYLKLNQSVDPTGEQVDLILDELRPLALQMVQSLAELKDGGQPYTGGEMTAIDAIKITKEVLTGWQITVTIPMTTKATCPI